MNHATTVPKELTRLIGRAIRALERTDMRAANEALAEACEAADHGRGYERLRAEHRAAARHPFVDGPGG